MSRFQAKVAPEKKAPPKIEPPKTTSSPSQKQLASVASLLPPSLLLNKKQDILTKTKLPAPDGSPDTRRVVGVGEEVEMSLPWSAEWSAEAGALKAVKEKSSAPELSEPVPAKGHHRKICWKAPAEDMYVVVKAKYWWGQKHSCIMKVQAPQSLSLRKIREVPYKPGVAGALMYATWTMHPLHVCLGDTMWREEPGPADDVFGYFTKLLGQLSHDPYRVYQPFTNQNVCETPDKIGTKEGYLPPPYGPGRYRWAIPNTYKLKGESSQGRVFTTVIQSFLIFSDGTVMVRKDGAVVSRKP